MISKDYYIFVDDIIDITQKMENLGTQHLVDFFYYLEWRTWEGKFHIHSVFYQRWAKRCSDLEWRMESEEKNMLIRA
jgi:hypothetical protein